ncbi:MAG: TIGR03905 family TSCPD domain-containing protein [Selenomonadaceae bacterium]|nr:TIGR03905 family TSCPD domain-containing protein [Selenomonadaceae bacterium]
MSAYTYKTTGTCSKEITVELEGNIIKSVNFLGGCPGNLAAISKIVVGMDKDRVIEIWRGNDCGNRGTSCADQLTRALEAAYEANK